MENSIDKPENTERETKYQKQTDELYKYYGIFIVEFEQLVRAVRSAIIAAFDANGLHKQQLTRILLADQTAKPLLDKLIAIIAIWYPDNSDTVKHLKPLFDFCYKLFEFRNTLVHGTSFIGWTNEYENEFDTSTLLKDKTSKKGIELVKQKITAQYLQSLIEEILIAQVLIRKISGLMVFGDEVIGTTLKSIDFNKFKIL